MVPTLGINSEDLARNGFIDGYIKDETNDMQYKNVVYLLFKPDDMDVFDRFVQSEFERTKQLIDDYDYTEGYTVLIYQLNHKFDNDFKLVKESRYSKTSEEFQRQFPRVKKIKLPNGRRMDELSLQYRIFNKTGDLVEFWEKQFEMTFSEDMEVWYGFFEEREILNINKIKEDVQRGAISKT